VTRKEFKKRMKEAREMVLKLSGCCFSLRYSIMPPEYVEESAGHTEHRFATSLPVLGSAYNTDNYTQDVAPEDAGVYPKHYDCSYNCTCLNFQGEHEESCPSSF